MKKAASQALWWALSSSSPPAAAAVQQAVQNANIQPKELIYNHSGINDLEKVTSIAEDLKVNTTTLTLYLNNNELNDEGVTFLADALKSNNTLKTLQLNKNEITDKGAEALVKMLQINTTLTRLEIDFNTITSELHSQIKFYLDRNRCLVAFDKGMMAFDTAKSWIDKNYASRITAETFDRALGSGSYAVQLLVLVVLFCDGYLEVNNNPAIKDKTEKQIRVFESLKKTPFEIQSLICYRAFGSPKTIVSPSTVDNTLKNMISSPRFNLK